MDYGEKKGEPVPLPDYKPVYSSLRLSPMNTASESLSKPDRQKNHKEVRFSLPQKADSSIAVATSSASSTDEGAEVLGGLKNGLGKDVEKSPKTRSPVSRISVENSASCISLMHSPPLQVMERPGDYDPNSMPSFGRPSLEWSVASNDSLFSIRIGKNSLARDYKTVELCASEELQRSCELVKNGEEVYHGLDFSKGDVKSSGIDIRNPQTPLALQGMETGQNLNALKSAGGSSILPGERREIKTKPMGNAPKALGNNKIIASIEIPNSSIADSRSENTAQDSSLPKKNKSSCPLQAICCLQKNLSCCSGCKCVCWPDSCECCKCCRWSTNKPSWSCWPGKCSGCKCFHCSSCTLNPFSSCDRPCCSCSCFSVRKSCQPSCNLKWCRSCWSFQCCCTKWPNCKSFSCCMEWPSCQSCCIEWPSCQSCCIEWSNCRSCCTKWPSCGCHCAKWPSCCIKKPICRCKPFSFRSCCCC